jgi:hypothetical protein
MPYVKLTPTENWAAAAFAGHRAMRERGLAAIAAAAASKTPGTTTNGVCRATCGKAQENPVPVLEEPLPF